MKRKLNFIIFLLFFRGINFASVHDSFWSHACDIDVLNKILREEFVTLYKQPLLENLMRDFKQSFADLHFPDSNSFNTLIIQ